MADAERLMNLMESFEYKSEQYNVCRKVLLAHLAQKPTKEDENEVTAWTMTGPSPFDIDMPMPVDLEVPAQVDFEIPTQVDFETTTQVDDETTTPSLVESPVVTEPAGSPTSPKRKPSSKKSATPKATVLPKTDVVKPKKAKKKTSRKSRAKQ
jgi:hypothetical protein